MRKCKKFEPDVASIYSAQMILALEYLHSLSIVYRDIKPENIMIDTQGYLKFIDLGLSKKISGQTNTICGTP